MTGVPSFHLLRFLTHLIFISRQEARHLGVGHPPLKRVLQEQQVRWRRPFIPALLFGRHGAKCGRCWSWLAHETAVLTSACCILVSCSRELVSWRGPKNKGQGRVGPLRGSASVLTRRAALGLVPSQTLRQEFLS